MITHGCSYGGCRKIGEGNAKAGMEQPLLWRLQFTGITVTGHQALLTDSPQGRILRLEPD